MIQGYNCDFEIRLFTDLTNIDLAAHWGYLFKLCQEGFEDEDKVRLMFLLSTIPFGRQTDMGILRSLIVVAIVAEFKLLQLPRPLTFVHFRYDQLPTVDPFVRLLSYYQVPYPVDERSLVAVAMHSKQCRKLEAAQRSHEEQAEESCKALAHHVLSQWPARALSVINSSEESCFALVHAEEAVSAIQPEWERLVDNHELAEHLASVQKLLDTCQPVDDFPTRPTVPKDREILKVPSVSRVSPNLEDMTHKLGTTMLLPEISCKGTEERFPAMESIDLLPPALQSNSTGMTPERESILHVFADSDNPVRNAYGKDLQNSLAALANLEGRQTAESVLQLPDHIDITDLDQKISSSRTEREHDFESIRQALLETYSYLQAGAMLPDITLITLPELLRTTKIPVHMTFARKIIIQYGEQVVRFQHLLRIRPHSNGMINPVIERDQ